MLNPHTHVIKQRLDAKQNTHLKISAKDCCVAISFRSFGSLSASAPTKAKYIHTRRAHPSRTPLARRFVRAETPACGAPSRAAREEIGRSKQRPASPCSPPAPPVDKSNGCHLLDAAPLRAIPTIFVGTNWTTCWAISMTPERSNWNSMLFGQTPLTAHKGACPPKALLPPLIAFRHW